MKNIITLLSTLNYFDNTETIINAEFDTFFIAPIILYIISGIISFAVFFVVIFLIVKHISNSKNKSATKEIKDTIDSNPIGYKTCEYCGTSNEVNKNQCSSCGASLHSSTDRPPTN